VRKSTLRVQGIRDDPEAIRDTTGAGDAFGAAIVNWFYEKITRDRARVPVRPSTDDWRAILAEARVWAAYACTTLGGAEEAPEKKLIDDLRRSLERSLEVEHSNELLHVDVQHASKAASTLFLLDRAYSSTQN
jgi:hypothetical protein